MKMRKWISGLLALTMVTGILNFSITASADVEDTVATELLSNGGFESSLNTTSDATFANSTGNWQGMNSSGKYATWNNNDSNNIRTGSGSARLNGNTAFAQRITQGTLQQNTYYNFEAYAKFVEAPYESNNKVKIKIGQGANPAYGSGDWTDANNKTVSEEFVLTTEWQKLNIEFKASDLSSKDVFAVLYNNNTNNGTAYFDDASLKQKLVEIDYENRKLTNFVGGEAYTITGSEITTGNKSEGSTELDIDDTWFGKQITITYDNVDQYLTIPADTAAPTESDFTVTQPEAASGTGTIEGITSDMEYKIGGGNWTDGDGTAVSDIPNKTNVQVRVKATENTFASESYTITIAAESTEPDPEPDPEPDEPTVEAKTVFDNETLQEGERVLFDFGDKTYLADGYVGVEAEKDYFAETADASNLTFGFLGIGAEGYSNANEKMDSFQMLKGEQIKTANGGSASPSVAADDNVYATQNMLADETEEYNMGSGVVPLRFAMKSDRRAYYKVKATVGCADPSEGATVSLFNEKRHPVVTDVSLDAGETKTFTFIANVMDVYYKSSGQYNDDMLNIIVSGKNAALASLDITRIEADKEPVAIWVCSDSTGCDQPSHMPFYPLQNYAGVGQYLSKYLTNMTVSNQGEGGLASGDNYHLQRALDQGKAGDYVYFEYGHNDKSTENYTSNLLTAYNKVKDKGMKFIVVGPIDRSKNSGSGNQWNGTNWKSSLSGYSAAGKAFVEEQINTNNATDIAFIDLNEAWLSFLDAVTDTVAEQRVTAGLDSSKTLSSNAVKYYYTYNNWGASDTTHINDAGADNAASIFFEQVKAAYETGAAADATAAQKTQAAVLGNIYNDIKDGVTPYTVSDDVVAEGYAVNILYPAKYVSRAEYPYSVSIEDITKNEDGTLNNAKVRVLQDINAYAAVYVKAYDANNNELGTIVSEDRIDNTADKLGAVKELAFNNTEIKPDHFRAVVYYCDENNERLTDKAYRAPASETYESVKYGDLLLSEDFSSYEADADALKASGTKWGYRNRGSDTVTIIKKTDATEGNYANISRATSDNYSYQWINLSETVTSGKLEISYKLRYNGGDAQIITGKGRNASTYNTVYSAGGIQITESDKTGVVKSSSLSVGTINKGEWIDYKYIFDFDNNRVQIYLGAYGKKEQTLDLSGGINVFTTEVSSGKTFDIDISDIKARKIETYTYPTVEINDPENMAEGKKNDLSYSQTAVSSDVFGKTDGAYLLKNSMVYTGASFVNTANIYASINIALDPESSAWLQFGRGRGSNITEGDCMYVNYYNMKFVTGETETTPSTSGSGTVTTEITLKPETWYNVEYVADKTANKGTITIKNIKTGATVATADNINISCLSNSDRYRVCWNNSEDSGSAYISNSYIYNKAAGEITLSSENAEIANAPTLVGQTSENVTVTGINNRTVTSVKLGGGEPVAAVDGTATLSVTGKDEAQTITVEFVKPNVTITYAGTAAGGTYSVTGIASGETVEEDTEITIVPVPEESYEVDKVYAYATTGGSASEETEVNKTSDEYKTTVTEDTTVSVTFKKKKYQVTFVVDGNETTVEVEHGSTAQAQAPKNPTKEGNYLFEGWVKGNSADGDVIDTWDVITANGAVYTAKFTEITAGNVAVTFSAGDGGALSGSASTEVTSGGNLTDNQIPVASKAGYTFSKWSDGINEYTVEELKALTIDATKEFTAIYTINQYTVTYASADNGSFEVTDIADGTKVDYNTEITIVPNPEEGYEVDKVYAYATTDGSASEETEVNKNDGAYTATVTEDTTIAVTFKEVQQPVTHTYIPLLRGFDDIIQLEKTNAASDTATLTVSLKDGVSAEVPALTAYIAVYSSGVLKEVRTEVFDSETGVVNITKPTGLEGTDSYKIFIWTDKYEPVTEPITAEFFE